MSRPAAGRGARARAARPLLAAAFAAAAALAGCGYSTGNLMPGGITDVAVKGFDNDTLYRRAEITYTSELSRQLVRRAGVSIRDAREAQAVIRGKILEIPRLTFVEDDDDRILEGGVLVRILVSFEDARTGEALIPPFEVARRSEYIVPRGETLQFAIDEALRDAAKDTVDKIESWSFLVQRERG